MKMPILLISLMAASAQSAELCGGLSTGLCGELPEKLCWERPTERENGDKLTQEELGGYTIQGFNGDELAWEEDIPNNAALCYHLVDPERPSVERYKIAAYDTDYLYSEFVAIAPKPYRLEAPADLKLE